MPATLKLLHKTIGAEVRRGRCEALVDGEARRDPLTKPDHRHSGRTRTSH